MECVSKFSHVTKDERNARKLQEHLKVVGYGRSKEAPARWATIFRAFS
jgi:hypothetical protein